MNLYDIIIRLGGSLHNEVEKHSVTAAEVIMLQSLHGEDAVRNIVHVGFSNESASAIRERMAGFYGTGPVETARSGAELVKRVFGPKNLPLPDKLEGVPHIKAPTPAREHIESLTA